MNPDLLTIMMSMQRTLQTQTYNHDFENMSDEERMDFIRVNVLALTDELHEALRETGWKPWGSSSHVNREQYTKELIDALHFMMNLFLVVEVDAQQIYRLYCEKHARNIARQEEGYTGTEAELPFDKPNEN